MEHEIVSHIERKGPLRGAELQVAVAGDPIVLWKTCLLSEKLMVRRVGIRYLRLDRTIEGFARLSPSILREFMTYSVIGCAGDRNGIERRAREITDAIDRISTAKLNLVRSLVTDIMRRPECAAMLDYDYCFIVAGDIVYSMAHDVPRPERSTGRMVKGSDIDMIVIAEDRVPDALLKKLDDVIYKEKYRLLVMPSINEEIDYIVKKMQRVRKQLSFSTFKHMVACKIIQEGLLLAGSEKMFTQIKNLLYETGVSEKLYAMHLSAEAFRMQAEEYLLGETPDRMDKKNLYLFYTSEESEEFE